MIFRVEYHGGGEYLAVGEGCEYRFAINEHGEPIPLTGKPACTCGDQQWCDCGAAEMARGAKQAVMQRHQERTSQTGLGL